MTEVECINKHSWCHLKYVSIISGISWNSNSYEQEYYGRKAGILVENDPRVVEFVAGM